MEKLGYSLFHATSSLFEDSIRELGLGGFNPIEELKVIELINKLEILANDSLEGNKDWTKLQYSTSLISKQRVTYGGNFQHGEAYLTPSRYSAFRYSKNKYGSEIITETFKIIDLLITNSVSIDDELVKSYGSFFNLRNIPCKPIIFEMKNLPIDYLSSGERGEDLHEVFNSIKEAVDVLGAENYEKAVELFNFRVRKPIPWSLLTKVSIP